MPTRINGLEGLIEHMDVAVKNKHERTCIGCGKRSSKGDFYRIVRKGDAIVQFDATRRAPGRGAYVCSLDCFEAALRGRKLQRALRVAVDDEAAVRIRADLEAAATAVGSC